MISKTALLQMLEKCENALDTLGLQKMRLNNEISFYLKQINNINEEYVLLCDLCGVKYKSIGNLCEGCDLKLHPINLVSNVDESDEPFFDNKFSRKKYKEDQKTFCRRQSLPLVAKSVTDP